MTEYHFALFDTALGKCGIAWSGKGIAAVQLPEHDVRATRARMVGMFAGAVEAEPPASLRRTIAALTDLLGGKGADLSPAVLDMDRISPFHRKVYEVARTIVAGETMSYGAVAAAAGSPGAARAVGQALGRNPFALVVPCHRVVGAGGKLGGFSANGGVITKARLLSLESPAVLKKTTTERGTEQRGTERGFGFDAKTAIAHLKRVDPVMARFMDRAGPFDLVINPADSVFGMLAEAIVYQQLTGKAAAAIFQRVCQLYSPDAKRPKPKQILGSTEEQLRGAGLSKAKALALLDLAARADSGELPTLAEIRKMPDDEVIQSLIKVRGVGQWTAQMFLIFRLGRPNVLPYDDYGLRRGYTIIYRKKDLPDRTELERAGEKWDPFRTAASWYLWRAAEVSGPGGGPPQH